MKCPCNLSRGILINGNSTIDFASISFKDADNAVLFEHEIIDGNVDAMKICLGRTAMSSESFETPKGRELKTLIQTTAKLLGLNKELGCSPITYYLQHSMVWTKMILFGNCFPKPLFPISFSRGATLCYSFRIQVGWGLTFNLFQGIITRNDLIAVCPYHHDGSKV